MTFAMPPGQMSRQEAVPEQNLHAGTRRSGRQHGFHSSAQMRGGSCIVAAKKKQNTEISLSVRILRLNSDERM
jgi:hypothetical protein